MAPNVSRRNGGSKRGNTEIIMLWKMRKENVTGCSGQDIIQRKVINGSFMDFLLKRNVRSMSYAELQVTSNFSFLRGASHPEEIVEQAAAYHYSAIAITDRNTLAGVVRAHVAAKAKGIKFITACCLDLLDGASLLAYPTDKTAYGRLCSLLTTGNFRTEKGKALL